MISLRTSFIRFCFLLYQLSSIVCKPPDQVNDIRLREKEIGLFRLPDGTGRQQSVVNIPWIGNGRLTNIFRIVDGIWIRKSSVVSGDFPQSPKTGSGRIFDGFSVQRPKKDKIFMLPSRSSKQLKIPKFFQRKMADVSKAIPKDYKRKGISGPRRRGRMYPSIQSKLEEIWKSDGYSTDDLYSNVSFAIVLPGAK
ncbi:Uncharacterised protein g1305 [Pycnogonum litorale]